MLAFEDVIRGWGLGGLGAFLGRWTRQARRLSWEAVRVPLAVGCILGGVVALTVPVWSGWWTARAQRVEANHFHHRLVAARPSGTPASGPTPSSSAPVSPARPRSTPAGGHPARAVPPGGVLAQLRIPAISVDSFVLQGLTYAPDNWSRLLREGPAYLQASALPGQAGNVVIFGHLNIWGAVFLHLDRLKPGAAIDLRTTKGTYVYRVTGSQRISPTDFNAVAPRHRGPATLQLVTCSGLLAQWRLVVDATLVSRPTGRT